MNILGNFVNRPSFIFTSSLSVVLAVYTFVEVIAEPSTLYIVPKLRAESTFFIIGVTDSSFREVHIFVVMNSFTCPNSHILYREDLLITSANISYSVKVKGSIS